MAQETRLREAVDIFCTSIDNTLPRRCDKLPTKLYANYGPFIRYRNIVTSERRKKPRKILKPNPFTVHKYKVGEGIGNTAEYCNTRDGHRVKFGTATAQLRAALCCTPQDLCGLYRNFTQNAKADLFAKANEPAVFDLAPVLAELGETLMWVGSICSGLKKLLQFLLTGKGLRLGSVWKGLRNPQSLWLEYRYALMPFILTIEDAIKAYKGGVKRTYVDTRITREIETSYTDPTWCYSGIPSESFNVRNDVKDTVTATARLYIKSQCDPSPLGVSAWDALRAAYEVLPLSFVLNWIVGVEEWLSSLRNTKLEVEGSYVTTVVNREGRITNSNHGPIKWYTTFDWVYHEYMMVRETDIEPPKWPLLQAEKLSLFRTVDAIALTITLLKGILSPRK